jgi:hypothetical protein
MQSDGSRCVSKAGLESKTLDRWEIAKVVGYILAGIVLLGGAITAVVLWLLGITRPNPRLLLTGALARRSPAEYVLLWVARPRRTPRQQKRNSLRL